MVTQSPSPPTTGKFTENKTIKILRQFIGGKNYIFSTEEENFVY